MNKLKEKDKKEVAKSFTRLHLYKKERPIIYISVSSNIAKRERKTNLKREKRAREKEKRKREGLERKARVTS